jgi:YgiT-type zinc finger domain-containing protein
MAILAKKPEEVPMNNKNCPACGSEKFVPDTRSIAYLYRGLMTKIEGIAGQYCDDCGEAILPKVEIARLAQGMKNFRQESAQAHA